MAKVSISYYTVEEFEIPDKLIIGKTRTEVENISFEYLHKESPGSEITYLDQHLNYNSLTDDFSPDKKHENWEMYELFKEEE
jgi:hypothetical protein